MAYDLESQILEKITKKKNPIKFSINKRKTPEYFNVQSREEYVKHRISSMKKSFLELLKIDEFLPINHVSIKPFYTYGMITSSTGKILKDEVYICNTEDNSNVLMKLNLEGLRKYSLFNGLVVAIKARNLKGNELLVEDIYSLPLITTNNENKGLIKVVIGRGTFTENSLEKLLNIENDILILFGPFCKFHKGYFSDFEDFLSLLNNKIKEKSTQLIFLVPSLEDNNFVKVFPQITKSIISKNIVLLDNPSSFYANNHLITVSNFDVLSDLNTNEYYKEIKEEIDPLFSINRKSRLAYFAIFQKSFSPVFPSTFNVTYGSWLDMEIAPDIFITSSKLKEFVGEINPVAFLNIGTSNDSYHVISSEINNLKGYHIQLNNKLN